MNEQVDNTGFLTLLLAFFMNVWNIFSEWFSVKNINEVVVLITGVLAMVYMFYKMILERKNYKKMKNENNK